MTRRLRGTALACLLPALVALLSCTPRGDRNTRPLTVFHASQMTAMIEALRDEARRGDPGLTLHAEPSGSLIAVRKIAELGRRCDLLILADEQLMRELPPEEAAWRLDFAADEMVLAVGARAPWPDHAETDWPTVLRRPDVRIGRVHEHLGSIGYRTLMVWKLQEALGEPGLVEALLAKSDKVVEHVTQLAPLLKTGEIDYGFVYRTLCQAWDLRFIPLDPRVHLGDDTIDYSTAELRVPAPSGRGDLLLRGRPIRYALTVPARAAEHPETAFAFIRYLLTEGRPAIEQRGYRMLEPPRFHGPRGAWAPLADLTAFAGETL